MAQLNWKQVSAPDLSGTSNILRNANASFNAGLSNASALLDSYNEGQQEKNDNALLGEIASLNSEEELGAFLSGDALKGKNISSTMRENILGLRKGILANESTRASTAGTKANTASTYARTAIAQAAEGRQASEYADGVAARTELRGLTGAVAGANAEGNRHGFATGNTRLNLARTLQAEAGSQGFEGMVDVGSVIRNRAASGSYGNGIDGVILKPGQFSAWNSVTGYAGGEQGQNMNFQPNAEALRAADAILSGQYTDQTGGATHYYNPDVGSGVPSWGNNSFVRRGAHVFGNADAGQGPVKGNTGAIQTNPKFSALQNAIRESVYLTPDQAVGLLSDAYKAQGAGQTRIDAANAAARSERSAGAILSGIQDPNITTGAGLTGSLLNNDTFQSNNERLSAVERGAAIVDGPLGSTLRPNIASDPLIDATVKEALAADQRGLDALPQSVILDRAERYEANPTKSLIDELSLGSDGNNPQTFLFGLLGENFDEVDVTRKINEVARAAGVSPAMAAAGMVEKFKRDPFRNNTLDRRFVEDEIVSYIQETMSPEAMTRYGNQKIQTERRQGELQGATLQLDNLRRQAAKYPSGEVPIGLQTQIDVLKDTIAEGSSPQEARVQLQSYIRKNGMADRLQGLDPNSADYSRAIMELEQYIQIDPDLSQSEKTLLLLTIQG